MANINWLVRLEEETETTTTTFVDDTQRRIQLQALDNEIEYNEVLITEREGEIQGIEQGISELNEVFRDLGMLVNEQDSGIRKYKSSRPLFTEFFYI